MFNSNKLDPLTHLLVVVHTFGADKTAFGLLLKDLAMKRVESMLTSLLGSTRRPPLWQTKRGFNFGVGLALQDKDGARKTGAGVPQLDVLRGLYSKQSTGVKGLVRIDSL